MESEFYRRSFIESRDALTNDKAREELVNVVSR